MKNKIYILFPGTLGHDLVYRCKFNASCWCTWHLEHERKDTKEKRTIMCAGNEKNIDDLWCTSKQERQ